MQTQTIKKTTSIVDFDNEQEIDEALAQAESGSFISFEESYKQSVSYLESLTL